MVCCCKLTLIAILIVVAAFVYYFYIKKSDQQLPSDIYDDKYWGKKVLKEGEPIPKDVLTLIPLKVGYDEVFIKDLHERLDKTRFVEPLQGRNFEDGFNGDYLKELVHYWRHNYDWKKQVEFLNQYPQFTTQIEGLTVHFVRVKPLGSPKTVVPILLMNGWPSNYYQHFKMAEMLRKPVDGIAFDVVIPSRPGFGYSEEPHREGFSLADSVRIYVKLMKRLGHEKFVYAGEDWGSIEGHAIGVLYPQNLIGVHSAMGLAELGPKSLIKMIVGSYLPSLVFDSEFEAKTFAKPSRFFKFLFREIGYFILQSTKPDTIGALLMDSPAGLAAYYLEKFSTGVDRNFIRLADGGLTKKLTMDELLTNIMIFWGTGNGAYAVRYYKEFSNNKYGRGRDMTKLLADPSVPYGFTIGEHEIDIGKMKPVGRYNIVKFDYLMDVGHFPSFEKPKEYSENIRKFVTIVLENAKNAEAKKTEL